MPKSSKASKKPATAKKLSSKAMNAVKGGASSPVLMQACATGVHLKEATITH